LLTHSRHSIATDKTISQTNNFSTRIYVAASAVDFRKAINGLAALIVEQ
jgi:transposase